MRSSVCKLSGEKFTVQYTGHDNEYKVMCGYTVASMAIHDNFKNRPCEFNS